MWWSSKYVWTVAQSQEVLYKNWKLCYDLQFINCHTAGQQQLLPWWTGTECHIAGLEANITFVTFFNKATARKVSRWMKCTQHLSKKQHGELPTNGRVENRYCLLQYWMASTNKVAHVCISNPLACFKVTRFPVLSSHLLRPIHQLKSQRSQGQSTHHICHPLKKNRYLRTVPSGILAHAWP